MGYGGNSGDSGGEGNGNGNAGGWVGGKSRVDATWTTSRVVEADGDWVYWGAAGIMQVK